MTQNELYSKVCETSNLDTIQSYVAEILKLRGFTSDTVQDKMLLLTEEVGELAKAIRKTNTSIAIDYSREEYFDTIENEIADVFIVLLSLCNLLKLDLYKLFIMKEEKNIKRKWERHE